MSRLGIGIIGVGALLLILASFAYIYQETKPWATVGGQVIAYHVTTPYRDYTFPLELCAIASFVVGFAIIVNEQLNKRLKG